MALTASLWSLGWVCFIPFSVAAAPEENPLMGKPVLGRNADGHLEVFQIDSAGQLRHRWQKPSNGDWSAWARLGENVLPGMSATRNANGEIVIFAVDRTTGELKSLQQQAPNSDEWSGWINLGGAVRPPLTAPGWFTNQPLEVFAVNATNGSVMHYSSAAAKGSSWSNLGGNLAPGLLAARNRDGRLELFGIDPLSHEVMHCWQRSSGGSQSWTSWTSLGGAAAPGLRAGQNVRGLLEVFAVNPTNFGVYRICQQAPGQSGSWTAWEDFGARVKPGLAIGQSADGRLEIVAVREPDGMLLHKWETLTDGSDKWSGWGDMAQRGQAFPAVAQNEDGNLEVFAVDPTNSSVLNHRRQISKASDWLDWSSLDRTSLQYSSRTWRADEGLPDNVVQALAQTRDGYLWVGTRNGLARFDGVTFSVFDLKNAPELKNPSITALCADRQGALWVGTDGGGLLCLRDGVASQFAKTNGLAGDTIKSIYESRDGALWIGTTMGLSRFKDGRFRSYNKQSGLFSDSVSYILEDRETNLWIATSTGLNRLRGETMDSFEMPNGLPNDSVRAICQDRGGRIWIGSNNGMLWYSWYWIKTFYPYNSRYGLSDSFVTAICEDREANLWVGTYSGLNRFHEGRFFNQPDNENVPFDKVNTLFEDHEGNLWVGSVEGLVRLTPKRFLSYTKKQGLTHNHVMSVTADRDGGLWIGTWGGGINRLKDERITAFASTNGFPNDLVLATCEDRDGGLWVGADFDGGLSKIKEGRITHYGSKNGLPAAPIRVLRQDSSGTLWVGTSRGLVTFHESTVPAPGSLFSARKSAESATKPVSVSLPIGSGQNRDNVSPDLPLPGPEFKPMNLLSATNSLIGTAVHAICQDSQGTVWIGIETGLVRSKDGRTSLLDERAGLSDNNITALYPDPDGTLWVGTAAGGLNRYRDGHFTACTTREGLFSDEIFEILDDTKGWLWMSCSRGVFRVRKDEVSDLAEGKRSNVSSTAYGKNDGMESTQCTGAAKPGGCRTADGRLWFATTKGVATVDPASTAVQSEPPAVYLEGVVANKRPIPFFSRTRQLASSGTLATALNHSYQPLHLGPGRAELEFHFTALDLQAPESCRFKYKLDNEDLDWNEAGSRRVAYYNNVAPGTYRFQVLACNRDGIWNPIPAELTIILQPHLWQTWWCRAGTAVFLLGLAGAVTRSITRRRMQRELERLQQRHALERERGRIAKDIHDDLGSSLTRIMMLGERAEEGLAQSEDVGSHVNKIVSSARHTVQALDEIVWAVNPENDTLEGLVEYITHYADEFFDESNLRCRLEIPEQLPSLELPAELRHSLFLVVKEAFHNILKHSGASEVHVRMGQEGAFLKITIADNGRGFDLEQVPPVRRGNGLGNMRKRIEGLGGSLKILSTPGNGTTLDISLSLEAKRSAL